MASIFSSSTDPLSTLLLYASNCWRSFRSRQVCTPKHNHIPTQPSLRDSLFMSLFLCPCAQGRDNKLQLGCIHRTPSWREVPYIACTAWLSSKDSKFNLKADRTQLEDWKQTRVLVSKLILAGLSGPFSQNCWNISGSGANAVSPTLHPGPHSGFPSWGLTSMTTSWHLSLVAKFNFVSTSSTRLT